MNSKQQAVLWMGLILIFVRMFSTGQLQDIWKTVVTPPETSSGGGTTKKPNCSGLIPGSPGYNDCMNGKSLFSPNLIPYLT